MSIKLTEQQNSLYKKLRIILYAITAIGLLYFTKELIFPTHVFNYYKNSNSLANTVTKPYPTKSGTTFDVSTFGEFDKAKVIIKLNNQAENLPEKTQLKIRKSYNSFLSSISETPPESQEITTYQIEGKFYLLEDGKLRPFVSEKAFDSYKNKKHIVNGDIKIFEEFPKSNKQIGFADGSLLAVEDDGVYVIEDGKRHAIDGEFTLRAFGFTKQENYITYVNREELTIHKKAGMFTLQDKHPNDTLFHATDTDKYFLYKNNNLYKIENPKSERYIQASESSRETFAECTLQKGIFSKYVCTIDLDKISNFEGNFYEFSVIDVPELDAKSIKLKFSQKTTKQNLYDRINEVKEGLTTQYGN